MSFASFLLSNWVYYSWVLLLKDELKFCTIEKLGAASDSHEGRRTEKTESFRSNKDCLDVLDAFQESDDSLTLLGFYFNLLGIISRQLPQAFSIGLILLLARITVPFYR